MSIDWRRARSKPVEPFFDERLDYVITVCDRARRACPTFLGSANQLHWGLDDPSGAEGTEEERLAAFQRTALEFTARLRLFIEILRRARRGAAAR